MLRGGCGNARRVVLAATCLVVVASLGTQRPVRDDRVTERSAASFTPLWEAAMPGYGFYSPAIGDDSTVYVNSGTSSAGNGDGAVLALDSSSGTIRWRVPRDRVSAGPALGAGGLVYAVHRTRDVRGGDVLQCLDARTGRDVWCFSRQGGWNPGPAVGEDGHVYACSRDGTLFAFEGSTGRILWYRSVLRRPALTSVALDERGVLYVTDDDTLVAFACATGATLWSLPLEKWLGDVAVGPAGRLYVLASRRDDGSHCRLFAIELSGPRELWSMDLPGRAAVAPLVGPDGTVYTCTSIYEPATIFALDGTTGELKWKLDTGMFHVGILLTSDATLIVAAAGGGGAVGRLFRIAADTGRLIAQLDVPDLLYGLALGDDGILYAGGRLWLRAYRIATGALAHPAWPKVMGNSRNECRIHGRGP